MIYVDSQTGFIGCVPVRSKGQYHLIVQELVAFPQLLGYHEVTYRADNEPTARQLLKLVVDTRLKMGYPTRSHVPPPYSHGNALAENCIGRIRGLTGTLMYFLLDKPNMKFSTNRPFWTWGMRHACWILSRYSPQKGMTPYELVYGKGYSGSICQFGEPVFAYASGPSKGDARWKRMIFLGKVESQDCFFALMVRTSFLQNLCAECRQAGRVICLSMLPSRALLGNSKLAWEAGLCLPR